MSINQVNQLRKALPRSWRNDQGIRNFVEQLIYLLSQTATATGEAGGSSDTTIINEAEGGLVGTVAAIADIHSRLDDIERAFMDSVAEDEAEARILELDEGIARDFFEYSTLAADGGVVDAVDFQMVTAGSNATVNLPRQPVPNSVIIVKKIDSSRVIQVYGNGKTIDSRSSINIRNQNTALLFHYDIIRDAWFIR